MRYGNDSETDAEAIATTDGGYTSNSGLRQAQHPSIWSLGLEASCICNWQTPGALHVEETAFYDCKRLEHGKLCNATRCTSIS